MIDEAHHVGEIVHPVGRRHPGGELQLDQLREWDHEVIRSPWDKREAIKEIATSQDHNHLNHATWECKYHVVRCYLGRDEEIIRTYVRNQEIADKQLDQLQLKLACS